jgi:pentose-5-phosphate-3-epimerase
VNFDFLIRANATGAAVSGSLLAVTPAGRMNAARALWSCGAWVHADVLEGSYAHQPGIDYSEIQELHRLNALGLDVHLMVDNPVDACRKLPSHLGRITIQVAPGEPLQDIIAEARARTNSLWLAADESFDSPALNFLAASSAECGVSGILVMLTPAGQPGKRAGADRIEEVRRLHQMFALPIGVDGDVNSQNLGAVVEAGATYVVSGRALMTPHEQLQ